jgi:4-carboxymuconolactone decarboxylase
LRPEELVGAQADVLAARPGGGLNERGEVPGPYAVMLHHPSTGLTLTELSNQVRFQGLLPDAAREAAILVVAAYWRDPYEWSFHDPMGRDAGMSDEQIKALHDGLDVTFEDPVTQAARDVAFAIMTREDVSDEEYARAREALDEAQLVEVTLLVGFYSMLAMQMRVFRIPTNLTF